MTVVLFAYRHDAPLHLDCQDVRGKRANRQRTSSSTAPCRFEIVASVIPV